VNNASLPTFHPRRYYIPVLQRRPLMIEPGGLEWGGLNRGLKGGVL